MRHTKEEKIAYLFDEIGSISDVLITEAAYYRPKKRRVPVLKYVGMAACLLLCCVLLFRVGGLVGDFFSIFDKSTESPEDTQTVDSLDALLTQHEGDLQYTTLGSVGELDLFGGQAYLVWQEEGSDELCVSRPLQTYEVKNLKTRISSGQSVGADPQSSPTCRVWIVCGDGTVITPYLKLSDGNIGVGELFDYDPELNPSSSFISYVSDILEQSRS